MRSTIAMPHMIMYQQVQQAKLLKRNKKNHHVRSLVCYLTNIHVRDSLHVTDHVNLIMSQLRAVLEAKLRVKNKLVTIVSIKLNISCMT